jgi:hypothetical protein
MNLNLKITANNKYRIQHVSYFISLSIFAALILAGCKTTSVNESSNVREYIVPIIVGGLHGHSISHSLRHL